ncbi:pyridine nucleotide-disulfide oxidoreductase [Rhodobacterales bacterium 52_120_T64]|nr:pyridine nucleotide-disulfide oxidoreductase [Rhodobacterales bacterium 52_120_T64]
MAGIIVIGAGQAGSSLVVKLRTLGFSGDITLIGGEPVPPYQRPPLSKKYMLGQMDVERLFLRPEAFYGDQNINLRLGVQVTEIDRAAKTVTLNTSEVLNYDQLALTTGSDPIRLPASIGGDLGGVYTVRTLADADAMAPDFVKGKRALIVGGGYIGLEAAAVAATRGVNVVLVEMADRILQRVAAPETSEYFRSLHAKRGVDIREGVGLASLNGRDGQVTSATLTDGTELEIDFVVVGVGIRPSFSLAKAAGLVIDNGIKVDEHGRTSDQSIFAAGDCASFPYKEERIRLESVPNAIEQAEATAAAMLGSDAEYRAKPWFWSDQYDVKLQIAGLNSGYDRVVSRKTDSATSFWYFKGNKLLAVDAMNDPRAYMVGKRLIEAGKSPDPDAVANSDIDMKTLL